MVVLKISGGPVTPSLSFDSYLGVLAGFSASAEPLFVFPVCVGLLLM